MPVLKPDRARSLEARRGEAHEFVEESAAARVASAFWHEPKATPRPPRMRYHNTAYERQSIAAPEAHCARSSQAIDCRDRRKGVIADRGDASAGPRTSERPTERCFGASVRIYSNAFSISSRAQRRVMRMRWRVSFGVAPVFRVVAFDRASDAGMYKSQQSGDSEWGGRRRRAGAKSLLELRKQLSGSPPCNRFPVNPSLTLLLHRRPNGRLMGRVANDCFEAS